MPASPWSSSLQSSVFYVGRDRIDMGHYWKRQGHAEIAEADAGNFAGNYVDHSACHSTPQPHFSHVLQAILSHPCCGSRLFSVHILSASQHSDKYLISLLHLQMMASSFKSLNTKENKLWILYTFMTRTAQIYVHFSARVTYQPCCIKCTLFYHSRKKPSFFHSINVYHLHVFCYILLVLQ